MLQWFCENHRSKSNDFNFFFILLVEPPSRAEATYTYLLNIYSHKYENGSKNNNEKPFMKTNCHLNNITKGKEHKYSNSLPFSLSSYCLVNNFTCLLLFVFLLVYIFLYIVIITLLFSQLSRLYYTRLTKAATRWNICNGF